MVCDMAPPKKRPLEEEALAVFLRDLATADAIAWSLSRDLEPPSEDDIVHGAEPLSKEQIQEELAKISKIMENIALYHLRATPGEWGDARLAIP
ncbi:hypothetical protein AB4144_34795 [Rhizobiaceae sp. 2RAB30]